MRHRLIPLFGSALALYLFWGLGTVLNQVGAFRSWPGEPVSFAALSYRFGFPVCLALGIGACAGSAAAHWLRWPPHLRRAILCGALLLAVAGWFGLAAYIRWAPFPRMRIHYTAKPHHAA